MPTALGARLLAGFRIAFGGAPDLVARAPGRVNLIGEHTDYNDGFALPIAIGAETQVAVRRIRRPVLQISALDYGQDRDEILLGSLEFAAQGGWRNYVRAVVATLLQRGHSLRGAEIAIAGDIPKGAGLSSSASLEIALIRALSAASALEFDVVTAALDAQRAENDFVGVRCGVLDQLSSAGGVGGCALLIDCRTLTIEATPLPGEAVVMIVQSGVERGLVDGRYNRRRTQCEQAASVLGVAALRDADLKQLNAAKGALDQTTLKRARHVITENARTIAAAGALARGDLEATGRLMAESHRSMRDDFEITVPQTDQLTGLLAEAIGPEGGARQTGGGFGGAVIGLMRAAEAERVRQVISQNYRTPAGERPDIRIERPCAGAGLIDL